MLKVYAPNSYASFMRKFHAQVSGASFMRKFHAPDFKPDFTPMSLRAAVLHRSSAPRRLTSNAFLDQSHIAAFHADGHECGQQLQKHAAYYG